MSEKERLDIILVKKGLAPSRELAKAFIMEGRVYINGVKADKAGEKTDCEADITVKDNSRKYVSRGGYKLEKAISEFGIDLNGLVCMDIGASTGGFTDCMLQNGADRVYSIDVGYGQLAWSLRNDSRVVCMEKTNVRHVKKGDIPDIPDFASVDVSFISLEKVLLPVLEVMSSSGRIVCLIKPQFEAGRDKVGKKGVVRDKGVHAEVIKKIIDFALQNGLGIIDISYSPIRGPEGNIEYLIYMEKGFEGLSSEKACEKADFVVDLAHKSI